MARPEMMTTQRFQNWSFGERPGAAEVYWDGEGLHFVIDSVELLTVGPSGVKIEGGAPITKHLSGTVAWDPASLDNGATAGKAVTVTGAQVGDTVAVGFTTPLAAGMVLTGSVTAENTVLVLLHNVDAGTQNLAPGTLRADVWQH